MTRPDARLLVPVSALPGGRAPEGARRVLRCGVCLDEQVHYSGCDAPDAGDHCTSPHDCGGRAAWFLDLSRPDVVDGVPVRLDALGWALGALGWATAPVYMAALGWVRSVPGVRGMLPVGFASLDVAGLSDDDASRAVVAAALRGGA